MAKLSARGRTEIARVKKQERESDGTTIVSFRALMSDETVLAKTIWIRMDGSRHDSGWGVNERKSGFTAEEFVARFVRFGYDREVR